MRLLLALTLAVIPPVLPTTPIAGFLAPSGPYSAGHRGVDLAATPGQAVQSPIDGIVVFAGKVGGKDVVTIGDGAYLASLEPVLGELAIGTPVTRGDRVGHVGTGGHCSLRCVHFGLRIHGEYVTPLRMRALLVP